jgi:hypothetical protein
VPDIDFFVDCLEQALDDLKAAIKPKKPRAKKKIRAVKA